jgi:hypothetical protein
MPDDHEPQASRQGAADWTDKELTAAVEAYLEMLGLEENGTPFKKSEYNAQLRNGALANRTKASVEYRMQNISSVMKDAGHPWLSGYVPAENVGPSVRGRISRLISERRKSSSRRRREHLLDAIRQEHILKGIELFDAGHPHGFADSTKFDLLYNGSSYPPKAIIGLAGVSLYGEPLKPDDFTGGAGSKCFRVLSQHGFQVVPKPSEFRPTAEEKKLDVLTREALSAPSLPKPGGQRSPAQVSRTTSVYERDPLVRAFVLRRSAGKCECCNKEAPFVDQNGEPFLEVHHIQPLAEGGDDVVENAAAICPNCHRECHHGQNRLQLRERLLGKAKP